MPRRLTLKQLNMTRENIKAGFALVGPYGNVWHDAVFDKPEDAIRHLTSYWRDHPWNPDEWKVVPATQTIMPNHGEKEIPLSTFMPGPSDAR